MELRYKHDRAGDTSPLTVRLTVQGAPAGADNALTGVGSATGLPDGVIDAEGWLKAQGGSAPYDLTAAVEGRDPLPPLYVLRVMKGHTPVASVTFRPIVAAGATVIDVNALHRAGQALAVSPEMVADLESVAGEARAAAQSVTDATLDLSAERGRVEQALADIAQQQLSNNQQTADALAALGGIPTQLSGLRVTATDDGYLFESDPAATTPATVQAAPLGGLLYEVM